MEANLAFSINDPEFRDFLPEEDVNVLDYRWTDFNIHDPGVTTLEAIKFSFEDLIYKYSLPIADILQGESQNALSSWNPLKLYTKYAVAENDYRSVLGCFEKVENAVVLPVKHSNISHNSSCHLVCLMDVSIASKSILENKYLRKYEQTLLKYRSVGEYFNRPEDQETFVRDSVTGVCVKVKMTYGMEQDTKENNSLLAEALEHYLLPELAPFDFREMTTNGYTLTQVFNAPELQDNLKKSIIIDPKLLKKTCYRNKIIVTKLYEVVQNLSFVEEVGLITIALDDKIENYKADVLELGRHQFTRLERLEVNGKEIKEKEIKIKDDDLTITSNENSSALLEYYGPTQIKGDYKKLGAFNSLQLSFPPNYGLGTSLVIPKEEVDSTLNFRTFLSVMDQIRGDWSAQMGNFSQVFSIDKDEKNIATENIAYHPFYAGTGVPEPLPIKDKIKKEFEEKRLNYLLALNGWSHIIELPVLKEKEVLKEYKSDLEIKQAFLNLVHYGVEAIEPVNKQLNPIFQATSLVLLQESIRVVLSREQCEVRILEHCFLQPVANKSLGVNFELTVFLFIPDRLDVERSRIEEWEGYAKRLLIGFVPAHIVTHLQFIYDRAVQELDQELISAYPKDDHFYFNESFSAEQLGAMRNLMDYWLHGSLV